MSLEALGDNSSLENDDGAFLIIGIKCGFLREWLKRGNTFVNELFLTKLQTGETDSAWPGLSARTNEACVQNLLQIFA